MSPLPERKKTPEELAKLRESLGVTTGEQAAAAPPESGDMKALEKAVFADQEAATQPPPSEDRPQPAAHSLRKSATLAVDQPKVRTAATSGKLPVRRHTDDELSRLRRMQATTTGAAIEDLTRKTLSKPGVVILYGLGGLAAVLLMFEAFWWSKLAPLDLPFLWLQRFVVADWHRECMIGLVGGLAAMSLLLSAWVAWRRPVSRHHAGFQTIVAVLVLVFGFLYFFPELYAT